jgi:hypothetical protein
MSIGKALPLTVVMVLFSMQVQAQRQTTNVCWADSQARCPAPYNGKDARFIACGTSGLAGFNPPYVCQTICGAPAGKGCRITAGPSASGGQCGYQAAIVECF